MSRRDNSAATAATLVFLLKGQADARAPLKQVNVATPLYQLATQEFGIANPFPSGTYTAIFQGLGCMTATSLSMSSMINRSLTTRKNVSLTKVHALLADCDFSISIVPVPKETAVKHVEKKKANKEKQSSPGRDTSPTQVQVRSQIFSCSAHTFAVL